MRRSRSFACPLVAAQQDRPRSTHACRLDDPLTWGILPARTYLNSRLTRWTLGASDIMFTNPLGPPPPSPFPRRALTHVHTPAASFLRSSGKVRSLRRSAAQGYTSPQSTPRSRSCAQARGCVHLTYLHHSLISTYICIRKSQVHVFAEGKVCQPHTYAADPQTGHARLRRFKWGMCVSVPLAPCRQYIYMKHPSLTSYILLSRPAAVS